MVAHPRRTRLSKVFLYTLIAEVEVHAPSRAKADAVAEGFKVIGAASGSTHILGQSRRTKWHRTVRSTKLHFIQKLS